MGAASVEVPVFHDQQRSFQRSDPREKKIALAPDDVIELAEQRRGLFVCKSRCIIKNKGGINQGARVAARNGGMRAALIDLTQWLPCLPEGQK
jgi:hypothetical protein